MSLTDGGISLSRPRQGSPIWLCRIGRRKHQAGGAVSSILTLSAQALDGTSERELSTAHTLDEVAAARDPQDLQAAQLGVERREATWHSLRAHQLTREDPVALQQ